MHVHHRWTRVFDMCGICQVDWANAKRLCHKKQIKEGDPPNIDEKQQTLRHNWVSSVQLIVKSSFSVSLSHRFSNSIPHDVFWNSRFSFHLLVQIEHFARECWGKTCHLLSREKGAQTRMANSHCSAKRPIGDQPLLTVLHRTLCPFCFLGDQVTIYWKENVFAQPNSQLSVKIRIFLTHSRAMNSQLTCIHPMPNWPWINQLVCP